MFFNYEKEMHLYIINSSVYAIARTWRDVHDKVYFLYSYIVDPLATIIANKAENTHMCTRITIFYMNTHIHHTFLICSLT